MKKFILFYILFFAFIQFAEAQVPEVPDQLEFGGLKLRIEEDAKKIIQGHVDALMKNPKYFMAKVEKASLYFPIIEKIFIEEGIPEDFKFLIIQESAFIGNAVSTSNAVGYWQFKKESAEEVGIVVNDEVDERMNIVAATRGAAKYLKRNNFYLNNWLHTQISYQAGMTGARMMVDAKETGAEFLTITDKTYWYAMKFLAHKIAFESFTDNASNLNIKLVEYYKGQDQKLEDIAQQFKLLPDEIIEYNYWLKTKRIPNDKPYAVILPLSQSSDYIAQSAPVENTKKKKEPAPKKDTKTKKIATTLNDPEFIFDNGLRAIKAQEGDDASTLALQAELTKNKIVKYNDLEIFDEITPDNIYYLEPKLKRGKQEYYIAEEGENLWEISQKLGMRRDYIVKYNRLAKFEKVMTGRVLWLLETRPTSIAVEHRKPKREVQILQAETGAEIKPVEFKNAAFEEVPIASTGLDTTKTIALETIAALVPFEKDSIQITPEVKPASLVFKMVEAQEEGDIKNNIHLVKTGETLFGISRQYQILVADLKILNSMDSTGGIQIGQKLLVKKPEAKESGSAQKQTESIEYTVATGDSLYKISKKYNVSIDQIKEWNNKKDLNISIGEKIKIFSTK